MPNGLNMFYLTLISISVTSPYFPKTISQLLGEEFRLFEGCEVAAAIELIPIKKLRVNLLGPAARSREIVRKYATTHRQIDSARIVALAEHRGLFEVEARR